MQTIYPDAKWRPLSDNQTEPVIVPTQLIWHTMVGYLASTEAMFRKDGYTGVESTFGLGGKYDGPLDGTLYQWQSINHQADAQFAGNVRANSIECSDGGHWTEPLSDAQVEASIRLGVWWCHQTGVKPVKCATWDAPGFGYHRMFPQWNEQAHECPGNARAAQLERVVWPEIARRLTAPTRPPVVPSVPPWPLAPGQYFGPVDGGPDSVSGYYSHRDDLRTWQRQMRDRGWALTADGLFGPETAKVVAQFQKEKGLTIDGKLGRQTWAAAWAAKVT